MSRSGYAALAGAECVLVGGIDDRPQCQQIAAQCKSSALIAAAETTVGELIALLSLCHGFAGNDSGCMHLAGALGVPTVALFAPTHPMRTRPLGRDCAAIYPGPDAAPAWNGPAGSDTTTA
jgi:ADP-heptose:LPS heptosyltransferase